MMLPMQKNAIISRGEVEHETGPGTGFLRKLHSHHGFSASGRTGESAGYQRANQARPAWIQLRATLPSGARIWAEDSGAAHLKRAPSGIRIFFSLNEAARVINPWGSEAEASRPIGKAAP
jgi:hypothetical protein